MAGEGSRFKNVGFTKPKPFIDVFGKAMIVHVLENLSYPNARYLLIAQQEHLNREKHIVKEIEQNYNAIFIPINKLTEGTVCSVLYAKDYIDNRTPLLIANSDQIVDLKISDFIDDCFERVLDGSILTFKDHERDPKWSFVKTGVNGIVKEVKEKVAISEIATVGIYLYSRGSEFVRAAVRMIVENERVNNEFYTCPTYNYAIANNQKIGVYDIDPDKMHGIGTPEDLESFVKLCDK